jgi:hypothetical protein
VLEVVGSGGFTPDKVRNWLENWKSGKFRRRMEESLETLIALKKFPLLFPAPRRRGRGQSL